MKNRLFQTIIEDLELSIIPPNIITTQTLLDVDYKHKTKYICIINIDIS